MDDTTQKQSPGGQSQPELTSIPASGPSRSRATSPPRRQRACVPCTRAKARCHFQQENIERHICDRCVRLRIECAAKTTKGLRKPRQIKPLLSRVAFLEQKLENMTTLLASSKNREASSPETDDEGSFESSPTPDSGPTSTAGLLRPTLAIRTPGSSVAATAATRAASAPTSSSTASSASPHSMPLHNMARSSQQSLPPVPIAPNVTLPFGISMDEAQVILDEFCGSYMPQFPFVIIGPDVTPLDMVNDRPFLFRSIVIATAPYPMARLRKMVRNGRAYLCHRMIVNGDRNMDLLQGLLVSIAWSRSEPFGDFELTTLIYLALGYCHNLGITKVPLDTLKRLGRDRIPDDIRRMGVYKRTLNPHDLDEQRALLGCYFLIASNSTHYGRMNPLRTPYVDICADNLAWTAFTPTDTMAEKNIRLIQISERAAAIFGGAYDRERGKPYAFLVEDNVKMLRGELDALAETVDPNHPFYTQFQMRYYYVLARLYEPASYFNDLNLPVSSPEVQHHSRCLFECLRASRVFLQLVTAISAREWRHQTLASVQYVQFIISISSRLLLLDAPGWDLSLARAGLDLVGLVDALAKVLRQADAEYKETVVHWQLRMGTSPGVAEADAEGDGGDGTLTAYAKKAEWARDWYVSRVRGPAEGELLGPQPMQMDWDFGSAYNDGGMGGEASWLSGMMAGPIWGFDGMPVMGGVLDQSDVSGV